MLKDEMEDAPCWKEIRERFKSIPNLTVKLLKTPCNDGSGKTHKWTQSWKNKCKFISKIRQDSKSLCQEGGEGNGGEGRSKRCPVGTECRCGARPNHKKLLPFAELYF